jgi:hypothetical protein
MATSSFDPRIDTPPGTPVFIGQFNNVSIEQAGGVPGEVSNMVLDPTRPFDINIEWQLDGHLFNVNGVLSSLDASKKWHIYVYAEKMGPGSDLQIYYGTQSGADVVAALPAKWTHKCTIAAGTLPGHDPGSGMYKLSVVVFANTNIPGGQDIIGCYDGPIVLSENPA